MPVIIQPLESRLLFVGIEPLGSPVDAGASGNISVLYGSVPIGTENFLTVVGQGDALLARIFGPTGTLVRNTFQITPQGFKLDNFADIDAVTLPNNRVMFSYTYFTNNDTIRDLAVTQLDTNGDILFTTTPAPGGANETLSHIALATNPDGSSTAGISYKFFTDNPAQSRIAFSSIDAATGNVLVSQLPVSTPTNGEQDGSNTIAPFGSFFFVGYRRDLFGQSGADTSFFSALVNGQTVNPEVRLFLQPASQGGTFGDIFLTPTPTGVNAFFDRGLGPTFTNPNTPKSSEIFFVPVTPTDTTATVVAPTQLLLAATNTQVIPVQVEPLGTGTTAGSTGSLITIRLTNDDFNIPAQNRLLIVSPTGSILSDNTIGTSANSPRTAVRGSTGLLLQTTQSQGFTFFTAQPLSVTQPQPPVQNVVVSIGSPQFNDRVTEALFTITLSAPADQPINLTAATREPPTGSAIPGLDYSSKTQSITIPAGSTSATFLVNRDVDTDSEGKTFDVDLTIVSGPATPGIITRTATIPARKLFSHLLVVNLLSEIFSTSQSFDTGGLLTPNTTSAPKLSGTLTLTATPVTGGDPITIGSQKVASGSGSKPKTFRGKGTGTAPSVPGQYTLSGSFTADSTSGATSADVSLSFTTPQGNDATFTVENAAKNGILLLTGDPDGTAATIVIKGPGTATLVNNGNGTQDLILTGTTSATKLTFGLSPLQPTGNDSRFNLRNIISDGPIGSVSATVVDVSGNIFLAGPITKGSFGNVKDQHLITLTGSVPATLSFLSLQNVTFTSAQPIKSLIVQDWLDTDSTPDTLSAPSIASLKSSGTFQSSLSLTGALGSATIAGNFSASLSATSIKSLSVTGTLGSSSPASPSRVTAATTIGKVVVGAAQNLFFSAGTTPGLSTLPASPADFLSTPSSIASFTITGLPNQSSLFSNTILAARSLGPVLIRGLVPASPTIPPTPFGLRALSITSYTQGTTKVRRTTTPQTFDSSADFSAAIIA